MAGLSKSFTAHHTLIGRTASEILPELAGQGFFELLDHVYKSGKPSIGQGQPSRLQRHTHEPVE